MTSIPFLSTKTVDLRPKDPTLEACLKNKKFIREQTVYKVASLSRVIEYIELVEEDASYAAYNWEPEKELALFFLKGEILKRLNLDPATKTINADHILKYLSLELINK